jgi:hypothetical protein
MKKPPRYVENCVYCVDLGIGFKVGFTSRLGDRLSAFQRAFKRPCYPIALITGLSREEAKRIEADIHARLGACRIERGADVPSFDGFREIFCAELKVVETAFAEARK